MDWDAAFFGTATITATSTGLCTTTTADRLVTVNPTTGATSFTAGATTVCQNAIDETYTATAANSTSITYSVLPAAAGIINPGTGVMNWDAAFSGMATITATATGLCGTTSADRDVTVNPSTGPTTFTGGATTVCQDAADETYTATALHSTSIAYSVFPASAGVIDPVSGVMNWNPVFFGSALVTATSTGLCGSTSASVIVTVNPLTGPTSFTAGATTVCQDAANETYTATAANSTSIAYSVLPLTAGTINSVSGIMNWDAAFSGTATITATATGLCGSTSADRLVTVNPSTGPTIFTTGAVILCQDAPDETYTATASNSTSILYSVFPVSSGFINPITGVMNWDASFSGSATITATATGLCTTTNATRVVTVNPSTGPTIFTAGPVTLCQDAADATYTATANNSTSIAYSVSPGAAGVIDAVSGVMDWNAAFFGTATITATSTGLCTTTTADRLVTVNPTTGATVFTAGATIVCQDAADETYTATAANSTSITYSVLPGAAGSINSTTGVMNWSPVFSGIATITATSTGLCGTTTADRIVTVNPSTGPTSFTGGSLVVCQDDIDEQYTAIAANSTSISYSVSPAGAGLMDAVTGIMDWAPAFSGTATITATSTGLCGTTSSNLTVTVRELPAITASPVSTPTCEFGTVNFDVTATGTGITYLWYVDANTGTFVPVSGGNYSGQTSPTLQIWTTTRDMNNYKYHVVVSGCLPDVTSADAVLTVNQAAELTVHPSDLSLCQGDGGTLTASGTGTSLTWQWLVNRNDGNGFVVLNADANFSFGSTVAAGISTTTLTITDVQSSYNNWLFRAKAEGICGAPASTNFARLMVTNPPIATIQPGDREICQNSDVTFTGGGSGFITMKWQVSTDGGATWNDISIIDPQYLGALTNQLTVVNAPVSLNGNLYHLALQGLCTTKNTNDARLTVNPNPLVSFAADINACGGDHR